MKLATFQLDGHRCVGIVADDRTNHPAARRRRRRGPSRRPGDHRAACVGRQPAGHRRRAPADRLGPSRRAAARAAAQSVVRGPELPRPCQGAGAIGVQGQRRQGRRLADRLHQGAGMRGPARTTTSRCRAPRSRRRSTTKPSSPSSSASAAGTSPAADALGHVFGYTIVNDVTARDVQMRHQQWDLSKSFDTFCPMGPWVVTADELDGTKTRVRCWVNGDLRQDGPIENMIFDIPTADRDHLAAASRCIRATSSPPARPPASAWA